MKLQYLKPVLIGVIACLALALIMHLVAGIFLNDPPEVSFLEQQLVNSHEVAAIVGDIKQSKYSRVGSEVEYTGDRGKSGSYCFDVVGTRTNCLLIVNWEMRSGNVCITKILLPRKWQMNEVIWQAPQ
jgi:hypothetical protein